MERVGKEGNGINLESEEFQQGTGMGDTRLKMEICRNQKRKIFVRDKGRKLINHPGGTIYVL